METQNIPTSAMNAKVFESIVNDPMLKQAQSAATNYTRITVREDGFAPKILPCELATDDMLDRGLTEDLQIIWEIECETPGSKWVPLQTVPDSEYIEGSRYVIPFARLVTPKFVKDIDELRTTRMDLRKVCTDNSIKDGLAEYDGKFIDTVNDIVFDCDDYGRQSLSGKIQLQDFADGLTRVNLAEAKKMLPRGNEQGMYRLRNYICLMNEITAQDLLKLDRNAIGGDLAEENFKNGLSASADSIMGMKTIFTIKSDLVPEDYMYMFAAPEFLGKAFYLQDWTMYMKKEAFFVEMFSSYLGGMAFGNIAGMALVRFNQTSVS